jgi:putative oxidoreductase
MKEQENMKAKLNTIAGGLLGLSFLVFGLNFFLQFIPMPPPPEGSPAATFMGVLYTTGFLTFVKVLEILGGILVMLPKTRNLGLLVLGPIVVNILAFQIFIAKGGLLQPPVVAVSVLAAFLLWSGRAAFGHLISKPSA